MWHELNQNIQIMRSKILTLLLCMSIPFINVAQQTLDGFFICSNSEKTERGVGFYSMGELEFQGMNHVVDASLTEALMLLSLLSLTYFVIKRKKGV